MKENGKRTYSMAKALKNIRTKINTADSLCAVANLDTVYTNLQMEKHTKEPSTTAIVMDMVN